MDSHTTASLFKDPCGLALLLDPQIPSLAAVCIDSPAGRERSGGVAGVSLELGRRAAPQGPGPGVQWRTRATVSTRERSKRGVEAAGASGSGKAQARLRPWSGGAALTKRLAQESGKRATARRSQASQLGKRRPREVRR